MPAYLYRIAQTCERDDCNKAAAVELRDSWNTLLGIYCGPHGDKAFEEYQESHEGDL